MAGIDLNPVGQRHQAPDARVLVACTFNGVNGEVRASDIAHEEGVSGEDGPRVIATGGVDTREARVLRAMPRQVDRLQANAPEVNHRAVGQWIMRELGICQGAHVHHGASGLMKAAAPRHVIGMCMGLDDVPNAHAVGGGGLQIRADVPLRVDDRHHAGVGVAHDIRRAAEVLVDDLPEEHCPSSREIRCGRWDCGARGRTC